MQVAPRTQRNWKTAQPSARTRTCTRTRTNTKLTDGLLATGGWTG
ncbi:hypothetical protein QN239_12555 [Mycolicibacterium sp. Y3]